MTGHRAVSFGSLVVLAILVFMQAPYWGYVLLLLVYISLTVAGSATLSWNYHLPALCRGRTKRKEVALTFDDGPDETVTPRVLEVLSQFDTPAAFFCIGEKAERSPHLVRRIHEEGHVVGNHSWKHSFWFDLLSARKMTEELERTNEAIFSVIGRRPRFFRPPYGVTNPMLRKAVRYLGCIVVGWNVRSMDTARHERSVLKRVMKRIRPGSIVLLHDTDEKVVGILQRILEQLREEGYTVIPLDRLIDRSAYEQV